MKRALLVFAGTFLAVMMMTGIACASECQGTLNINTATIEEMVMLPGIGEATAQNIVTFRDTNGPFQTVDELIKVKGIGEKKLEVLRTYLTVEGESTLTVTE